MKKLILMLATLGLFTAFLAAPCFAVSVMIIDNEKMTSETDVVTLNANSNAYSRWEPGTAVTLGDETETIADTGMSRTNRLDLKTAAVLQYDGFSKTHVSYEIPLGNSPSTVPLLGVSMVPTTPVFLTKVDAVEQASMTWIGCPNLETAAVLHYYDSGTYISSEIPLGTGLMAPAFFETNAVSDFPPSREVLAEQKNADRFDQVTASSEILVGGIETIADTGLSWTNRLDLKTAAVFQYDGFSKTHVAYEIPLDNGLSTVPLLGMFLVPTTPNAVEQAIADANDCRPDFKAAVTQTL